MSAWKKLLAMGLASVLLAACGGGGGDGGGALAPPEAGSMRFDFAGGVSTLPSNRTPMPPEPNSPYYAQLNVRVLRANGSPVADGTVVNIRTDNVRSVALSVLDDPTTTDVNEFTQFFGVINAPTSGGLATFFVHSQADAGSATLTASAPDPENTSRTLAIDIPFSVTQGPAPFQRIQIEAQRTVMPANVFGIAPFWGSPFITETTVTRRNIRGELLPSGTVQVTLNPITNTAYSTLDDPTTADINEFEQLIGQGPEDFVAGKLTLFIHSFNIAGQATQPGPFTLTITAIDPDTGGNISAQQGFTIVAQAPQLPANIEVIRPGSSLYVQGSGGNNTLLMQALVTDGAAALIPDPPAGATFNNVQFEVVGAGAGGELFRGVNAAGQNVQGGLIKVRTQQGIAGATLVAGTRQGTIQIRVTSDAADNNVDNGITSPVIREETVIISDGKLFSLEIVSPNLNALRTNRVSGGVAPIGGSTSIPTDPNGTYSLTISVLATDRQGNPVLPGTPIDFGLIDSPVSGFPLQGAGGFLLSGGDGDPQEGGGLFTAPTGQFTTAAGPGDTLLVFGQQVPGNRDLESARRVDRVTGPRTLLVTQNFNLNDDTGAPVDNGPVLPYVIGRATVANITPNVLTNDLGIATTTMNYPVNQLGRVAAIWARGAAAAVQNVQELVTDAELIVFPGAGPATLVASPGQIPGNRTATVTICVADALGAPIQGVPIGFNIANPSTTTTVDGQTGTGVLTGLTGTAGCTTATVVTAGVANSVQAPSITFFGVGGSAIVTVTPPTISLLQAFPSSFFGGNGGPVRLRLINGNGEPIPGVLITGTCTGTGGAQILLTEPPGITNGLGETLARISAINLDQPQSAASGSCTFAAAGGSPTTTVSLQGVNLCSIFFSPLCN
jgi:hypothetical protein